MNPVILLHSGIFLRESLKTQIDLRAVLEKDFPNQFRNKSALTLQKV